MHSFVTTAVQMVPPVVCDTKLTSNTIRYITVDYLFYYIQMYLLSQLPKKKKKKYLSSSKVIKRPNVEHDFFFFFFKVKQITETYRQLKGKRNHIAMCILGGKKDHKTGL